MIEQLAGVDVAILAGTAVLRWRRPDTFARLMRAAVQLAGIAEALPGDGARLREKIKAIPAIIRAAVRRHRDGIPVPVRLMIAAGVGLPIVGPVDEALAAISVAGLMFHPATRAKVRRAWQQ